MFRVKLRLIVLAFVAAAGLLASLAFAAPPPGKGKNKTTTTSTTAATTTTSPRQTKVLVCHKVGKGKYVLLSVAKKSAPARLKKTKDVLAVNGTCPGPDKRSDGFDDDGDHHDDSVAQLAAGLGFEPRGLLGLNGFSVQSVRRRGFDPACVRFPPRFAEVGTKSSTNS